MTIDKVSSFNISRVLNCLYHQQPISRIEISRQIGLDRSTVSKIMYTLDDYNIVEPADKGVSTPRGGRRPDFLQLNNKIGFVIGMEVQTDRWFAVGVTIDGSILFTLSETLTEENTSLQQVIEQAMQRLTARCAELPMKPMGVVVTLPGIIDPFQGIILRSNPLNIDETLDLKPIITRYFDVPVLVENDANSCCWGELFKDKLEAAENFLSVLVELRRTRISGAPLQGIGVGLGIVLNKHVHYGKNFSAGEFQSVFCKTFHSTQFSISDEEAAKMVSDEAVLVKTFEELAINLSLLVNTFNLSQVIILGDLSPHRENLSKILQDKIQENWSYDTPAACEVRFTDLGRETVAFGAACMFIERLFSVPTISNTQQAYACGFDLLKTVLE
ncbi:ROK family transcriptional regulator [Spirochaeta lutea]|uniref:HTH marR-type domain-containing protein n=1 Tax=Spirochaeta lutea TaxID=1480694 RepID=A0A098QXY5_9SPIO|nr:ROK family transcriptional regulator [Spirochaeta lutea]KGE72760.1 hypothetical protein DC28_05830 [Spirochaeta lutea]